MVTPADAQSVVDDGDTDASETDDNVVFDVENPVADTEHDIILVDADLVDVDADGVASFLDAAGDPEDQGFISETAALESDIAVVNGNTFGGADDQYATGTPVGGNLTFTVNSNGFEEYVAIVFFDEDGDTNLDLDANGVPATDEPFGIAGAVNVLPTEAATASIVADSEIYEVNKDENDVVVDLGATGNATPATPRVVFYDEGDDLYVGVTTDIADQVTLADFEAVLTVGDFIDASTTYSQNFALDIALQNEQPVAPDYTTTGDAAASSTSAESSIEFDIDEDTVIDGATVNVYLAADGEAFADANLVVQSTADEDADTADYQVTIGGLTASTDYEVYLTQEVDGEESDPNFTTADATGTAVSTTAAAGDLAIASVSPNEIIDGANSTAELIVTFNEAATLDATVGASTGYGVITVYPTNQPGIQITLEPTTSVATQISGSTTTTWTVTLDDVLNDNGGSVAYTIEIDAGVADDGAPNAALEATFNY